MRELTGGVGVHTTCSTLYWVLLLLILQILGLKKRAVRAQTERWSAPILVYRTTSSSHLGYVCCAQLHLQRSDVAAAAASLVSKLCLPFLPADSSCVPDCAVVSPGNL